MLFGRGGRDVELGSGNMVPSSKYNACYSERRKKERSKLFSWLTVRHIRLVDWPERKGRQHSTCGDWYKAFCGLMYSPLLMASSRCFSRVLCGWRTRFLWRPPPLLPPPPPPPSFLPRCGCQTVKTTKMSYAPSNNVSFPKTNYKKAEMHLFFVVKKRLASDGVPSAYWERSMKPR